MLKNLTHNNPVIRREVEKAVGKEHPFFQRLKMGGTGSQKFVITEASEAIMQLVEKDNSINYAHIEIRPLGIIIRFKSYQETYGLVVPFAQLKLNREPTFVEIASTDFFMKLETLRDEQIDSNFLNRILQKKGANEK